MNKNEIKNPQIEIELSPSSIGEKFNQLDGMDFIDFMRNIVRRDPSMRFIIVANWVDVNKTRSAKAILDMYALRLNIDSFIIRASRDQYEEDVNAFASGLRWEEIK